MSETEKLLKEAHQIASRTFSSPTETTVMDVFRELCTERELPAPEVDDRETATWH